MKRTWTPADGTCEVLTFKAGLLSAVGHDLLFRVSRFELTLDGDRVQGWFDGTSLVLVGAMKGGKLSPGALSAKDEREILDNVKNHVFKARKVERITFEAEDLDVTDESVDGDGTLVIPPARHGMSFSVHVANGRATAEMVLHQPDWGITPFKALMGALRIQPDVRIRLDLPWS